jgi:hypothetical protein
MKDKNMNEANLLLNNEVKVTLARSQFFGKIGRVLNVMADGRTLEIEFDDKVAMLDVTFVDEVRERTHFVKDEPDLGPIANSVVQSHK